MIILAHWKTCSGIPISVNWTFFARCWGWSSTREYWFKIGDFAPTGAGLPKISGRGGRPTNYSFSQKTGLNVLSCGKKKIWTDFSKHTDLGRLFVELVLILQHHFAVLDLGKHMTIIKIYEVNKLFNKFPLSGEIRMNFRKFSAGNFRTHNHSV